MKYLLIIFLFLNIAVAKIVVTPYLGKQVTTPPNNKLQDDEAIYGVAIRGYIDNNYAIDMRVEGSSGNLMEDGGRTDIERGSLNLFYDFYPDDKISHYLFGGIGYEQLHRSYQDMKSQPFFDAGFGVRMKINRNLEVMTEAKYLKKMDTKDGEVMGNFGFGYIFTDKIYKEKDDDETLQKEFNKRPQPVFVDNNSSDINSTIISSTKDDRDKLFLDEVELAKNSKGYKNYIQIAALTKKTNLKNCIKILKSKGFKTKVIKKHKSSVVYVGPYAKSKIKTIYHEVKKIYKDAFYKKL